MGIGIETLKHEREFLYNGCLQVVRVSYIRIRLVGCFSFVVYSFHMSYNSDCSQTLLRRCLVWCAHFGFVRASPIIGKVCTYDIIDPMASNMFCFSRLVAQHISIHIMQFSALLYQWIVLHSFPRICMCFKNICLVMHGVLMTDFLNYPSATLTSHTSHEENMH